MWSRLVAHGMCIGIEIMVGLIGSPFLLLYAVYLIFRGMFKYERGISGFTSRLAYK